MIVKIEFGSEPIALGGVFFLNNAPSKNHVMRDFSKTPLNTDEDVDKWLRYFEFDPPMLFQSVLVTSDAVRSYTSKILNNIRSYK